MTPKTATKMVLAALFALSLSAHGVPAGEKSGARSLASRGDTSGADTLRTREDRATSQTLRMVRPPELFDRAFRNASAARHADEIAKLTRTLTDLGPGVDPAEAARAARAVYTYVDQLVEEYEINDPALVHNTKVNMGLKPRGLCWHWAQDLDIRLQMENLKTLKIFRAIANYDNIRLEHSTTLLGVPGGSLQDAIVLDPWREGGELFWMSARADTRYDWAPRSEVFDYKAKRERRNTPSYDGLASTRNDR
jgi:hypothetical protein